MKLEFSLFEDFGSNLADGTMAAEYRASRLEPYIAICEELILDFSGVRSANSSFVNALISRLVEQHGADVLSVLVFKGCSPVIRILIESAIVLGLQKGEQKVTA